MATRVTFTVTASATVASYWVCVGNEDVPISNGKGTVVLDSSASYLLVWHFEGEEGDTLGIVGMDGNKRLVEVKASTIPIGESAGAGSKRFTT